MKRKIIYLLIFVVSTYFAWSFTKSKISQPTIGGNFNLVNQFEEQVSLDNFKDDYLLIYLIAYIVEYSLLIGLFQSA